MTVIRTPIPKHWTEFKVDLSAHNDEYVRHNFPPGALFEYEGDRFEVISFVDGVLTARRHG